MRPVRRFSDQDALRSAHALQERLIPFGGDWPGRCPNNRRIILDRAFHTRLRIVLGSVAGRFGETAISQPASDMDALQCRLSRYGGDRTLSVFTYVAVSPRLSRGAGR